jgi:glycosyltransferase involved in cell wall biosynthesis
MIRVPRSPAVPPQVAIVVPARNEADNIAQSVTSLLAQDYPALALVLVDDDSDDGTADIARRAAAEAGAQDRLTVIRAGALPPRWTGKLWAVKQGIAAAEEKFAPKYLMLTDADIVHVPDTVRWLVAHSRSQRAGTRLADRALALREFARARTHPGLHLLFRDALIRLPG